MSCSRIDFGQRFSRQLARRHGDEVCLRVTQKQPDQLFAGITGCADDGYPGPFRVCHRANALLRPAAIATKDYTLRAFVGLRSIGGGALSLELAPLPWPCARLIRAI